MRQVLYVIVLTIFLLGCHKDQPTPEPISSSSVAPPAGQVYTTGSSLQLTLGNPSQATTNPANTDNLLLIKESYVVSYNNSLGCPNWVSWHIQKSDLGLVDRQDDFRPDASLPTGYYQVRPTDYTAADGLDRGHLCPSADRANTLVNNSATFLMTNIIPQAPTLNRGVWKDLESYCRDLVQAGNELYIIAGGYGSGATGSKGFKAVLSTGKVKPSAHCWKLIIALPEGDNDLSRINAQSTVIAVDMLNTEVVRKAWSDYIVTVNDLEKATNYTFLSALPGTLQAVLKAKAYTFIPVATPPANTTTTPPATSTVTPPATTTTTPPTTTTTTTPSTATATPPVTTTTTPPVNTPPTTGTVTSPTTTTTTTGDVKCGLYNGKQLYRGPQGGCYYINSNGNKTYVDRSYCTC